MLSLFSRLKSGTEQQHQEIEAIIDPMKNFSSTDTYKDHLLRTWTFYRSLEADLAELDWSSVKIDFASRRKTPLLEEDLTVLGVPHTSEAKEKRSFERMNVDFALGCLYVVEGATMGGQVISRHLAKLGIGPENGGRFFNGYGAKTGDMWKSFQTSATDYCVSEPQITEAVNGAKWTFERFRESMLQKELITYDA